MTNPREMNDADFDLYTTGYQDASSGHDRKSENEVYLAGYYDGQDDIEAYGAA